MDLGPFLLSIPLYAYSLLGPPGLLPVKLMPLAPERRNFFPFSTEQDSASYRIFRFESWD